MMDLTKPFRRNWVPFVKGVGMLSPVNLEIVKYEIAVRVNEN